MRTFSSHSICGAPSGPAGIRAPGAIRNAYRLVTRRQLRAAPAIGNSRRVIAVLTALLVGAPQPLPLPPPLPAPRDVAYPGTLRVDIDARDIGHRVFRVRETLPVLPGPLTLLYPEWVPGAHSAIGTVDHLAGLRVTAGGKRLAWRRDTVASSAFHVDVPAATTMIEIAFDVLTPTDAKQGRVVISDDIAHLQWHTLILYPAGYFARDIMVVPSVALPAGWHFGSALDLDDSAGDTARFRRTDLETLVDSPLLAGRWFRRIPLDGGPRPVALDLVADSEEALAVTETALQPLRTLVAEADRLFGGNRPFDHYDFLVALTGSIGAIGREHHRSTEIAVREDFFTAWARTAAGRATLPHEYVHSWNGKYRQGADSWIPDFNTPIRNSLLWVYEGQTQYWGVVLAARAGLITAQEARDALAQIAATAATQSGRAWKPLSDTVNDPLIFERRPEPWYDWQRNLDYYGEGALIWLEADTLIRERSDGVRSLDDFARRFFGNPDGDWNTRTYARADVVTALNAVQAHDWAAFLATRLDGLGAAPLGGLARGGYRLGWSDTPSDYARDADAVARRTDLGWSLGFVIDNRDATLSAVRWNSPAYRAGLTVGTQLIAVGGLPYTPELLVAAVRAARGTGPAVGLLVKKGGKPMTVGIEWNGGLRYPRLERIAGTPARLDDILAPTSPRAEQKP